MRSMSWCPCLADCSPQQWDAEVNQTIQGSQMMEKTGRKLLRPQRDFCLLYYRESGATVQLGWLPLVLLTLSLKMKDSIKTELCAKFENRITKALLIETPLCSSHEVTLKAHAIN